MSVETEEFFKRIGYAVVQGYGMTETASLISLNHPFKVGRRSIGKVLPGREMKLDPETGEILVRGENVARQYWQGKELKPVTGGEGWFRTGDLGAVDAEGNLYFKGRTKNVIVTPAGLKIYPEDLEQALRRQPEVRDCVVFGASSMDSVIADGLAMRRFSMILLATFASLALLLASIGIYGVVSYVVGQRSHEIGIRMALGAQRGDVLGMIMAEGGRMALIGVGFGLGAALTLTRFMAGMLFAVKSSDPTTFTLVAVILCAVALLACFIPARRATQVDPMTALRHE